MRNKKADKAKLAATGSVDEHRPTSIKTREHISYPDSRGRQISNAEEAARQLRPELRDQVLNPAKYRKPKRGE